MSQSRAQFVERYKALVLACTNEVTFDDPSNADKDLCAKLLRSSLAVAIFSTLESFVKDRTSEILASIDHQKINFSQLPEGIQNAATLGAVKALNFRLQLVDKANRQKFAIDEASQIASVGTTSYALSGLSFGHDKSNLSVDDISNVLECFQVDSGWGKIKILASRVGFGGAGSYDEVFRNIASRRHLSAHTMTAKITQSDITDSLPSIYAIAISFDLLLSKCLQLIKERDATYFGRGSKKFSLDPNSIPISRIEHSNGKWRFKSFDAKKSIMNDIDGNALFVRASAYCETKKKSALVQVAPNGQPTRWHY